MAVRPRVRGTAADPLTLAAIDRIAYVVILVAAIVVGRYCAR